MDKKPQDFKSLFRFYYDRFKPLYSHVQALSEPPVEMLFELNAAFDHLSRHWSYGESQQDTVQRVIGHLKRGCFDAFKLVAVEACDHYDELRGVDISIIDNGQFEGEMLALA